MDPADAEVTAKALEIIIVLERFMMVKDIVVGLLTCTLFVFSWHKVAGVFDRSIEFMGM